MSDEAAHPAPANPLTWPFSGPFLQPPFLSNPFQSLADAGRAQFPGSVAAAAPLPEYLIDTWQRAILFLDLLRVRGNEQAEITSRPMATVLNFDHEVLLSGRSLARPINYSLSRIVPPEGTRIDLSKRPVVVVDPRAGQGPGIGGFKTSSEIGEALTNGHAVYFIGFAAKPEPGQTFLDVVEGQVRFIERIRELHPDAPKPFAIGNCQAGYQTLMVAMLRPDLFGPVMVAGSPISYWQGEHGKNPMRYSGGLLGGSWLTNLVSDLSQGRFDGTWLILNFDNLNPGNWLWAKQYDVFAAIDTEGPRYLEFEKWWGDFIELNGPEIQYLVDEMFIGDRLTRNELRSTDGKVFDLRDVSSPIIVFTSLGDNISPPPQTLGWILDLYRDVDDMRAEGRTVVYCLNRHVGHLAIFVSSKVGAKEDAEMVRLMNLMDCLPPGLYELVITPTSEEEKARTGRAWHSQFKTRSFDDLRAFGRNSVEDDRAFATVKRVSEINHSLYRTYLQPLVQATATPQLAQLMFQMNPLRLSYTLFADTNPFMKGVAKAAEEVRAARRPAREGNPFLAFQKMMSDQMNAGLDLFRDMRDKAIEQTFFAIYGSPALQAMVGLNTDEPVRQLPPTSPEKLAFRQQKAAELEAKVDKGGFNEALVRAVLFVLSAERTLDEHSAAALNEARQRLMRLTFEDFKQLVREQYYILLLNRHRGAALEALATLVPEQGARQELVDQVASIIGANGGLSSLESQHLSKLASLLGANVPRSAYLTLAADNTGLAPQPQTILAPTGP